LTANAHEEALRQAGILVALSGAKPLESTWQLDYGGELDPMTPNVPAALINTLVVAFFVVLVLGVGLGTYAAVSLKKLEKKVDQQQ
jgi:hypothetical protein